MFRLIPFLFLILLPVAAFAADFPAPEVLLDREAVAVSVVNARPDDRGFQELLSNAWQTMKTRESGVPPYLGMALKLMGRGSEEDGLLSFLPAQVVRVDRMEEGRLQPTFAFTLAGWPGIQGQAFHQMEKDEDGEPWPTRKVEGQTLIVRDKDVVARVRGTFLNCPNPERAETVVRALTAPGAQPPQTRLLYALQKVDRAGDLYGVMLNQDGGLMRFLDWLEFVDLDRVEQGAPGEDLAELSRHVGLMAWDGDLVDGDELRLHARFETDAPEAAERLSQVLQAAHGELARRKRVGHWQVGTTGAEVDLRFSMIGFRKAVQGFVKDH